MFDTQGKKMKEMRVDGGMANNDNFIQLSVKKLNIPIEMISYQNKTGNF